MGNGTVQDAVTDRSGITGEKMELDGYLTVEGCNHGCVQPHEQKRSLHDCCFQQEC